MDRSQILESIDEEIAKLERVRELLSSSKAPALLHVNGLKAATGRKKRVLSEEARNRIAQAQKRRWAKQRKEASLAKKAGKASLAAAGRTQTAVAAG
jgi:hypothetical protein